MELVTEVESFLLTVLLDTVPWLKDGDHSKILLLAVVVVGLLLLGRWISARSESSAHDPMFMSNPVSPVTHSTVAEPPAADSTAHTADLAAVSAPESSAAVVHPEMDFGPVLLRRFYFNNFDALSGPADPAKFFNELTVQVLFKATGAVVENTYTVATPLGMSELMAAKQWGTLYSPEMFVVTRYDLEAIREAVMEHLLDNSETRPLGARGGDEVRLG